MYQSEGMTNGDGKNDGLMNYSQRAQGQFRSRVTDIQEHNIQRPSNLQVKADR